MRRTTVLALGLLLALSSCRAKHSFTTPSQKPTPSRTPTAVGSRPSVDTAGRLLAPFSLDGGALAVTPGGRATLSRTAAVGDLKTAENVFYHHVGGFHLRALVAAHGLVTLRPSLTPANVGAFTARPAWVVFYAYDAVMHCPLMTAGAAPSTVPASASTWHALVIDDTETDAVLYTGQAATRCTPAAGPTTEVARQHFTAAWHEVSRSGLTAVVGYTLDGCGQLDEQDIGTSPTGESLNLVESRPFARLPCPAPQSHQLTIHLSQPQAPITHLPFGRLGSTPGLVL